MSNDSVAVYPDLEFAVTPQRTLRLNLRVPRHVERPPLIIYIPVGGMRFCDRQHAPWDLVEQGFAMASIDARMSHEAIAPAVVHDCKSAIRWLRVHAAEYGYRPDAFAVWGHSAGGLLASLLGATGDVADLEGDGPNPGVSTRVQAVCDQCGAPHDFTWFARPEIKKRFPGVVENLRLYLGGLVEDRLELARQVSPSNYLSKQFPPILLIHGEIDEVVPFEETVEFHKNLKALGVDATLRSLPGVGHGWDTKVTNPEVVAFFQRTLNR